MSDRSTVLQTVPRRRSGVQSIDRAVTILRCFDARGSEHALSDLARATGLSTTTVHRLLNAMQTNDLIRQTGARRYALGPLLLQLTNSRAMPRTLKDAALPFLSELGDELNETIGLHELLEPGRRVVVAQVESCQELRGTYTALGVPLPLASGAPGRAILFGMSEDHWSRHMDDLSAEGPDQLRIELRAARAVGFIASYGERTAGLVSIASPIFDATQRVVGALSASLPAVRVTSHREELVGNRVREFAWHISTVLGASAGGVESFVPGLRLV